MAAEKLEMCPQCGALCNDDQTIEDHGKCYDCQKAWQHGKEDERYPFGSPQVLYPKAGGTC